MNGREGQIITFYSFKGGTGRTMALANVAWILAANGHRVLVADWDLESPGLHRFFHPFMPEGFDVADSSGIIEMIREYEWAAAEEKNDLTKLPEASARVQRYAFSLEWDHFAEGGSLHFLSPGRQNLDYAATVGALDWENFYERLNGSEFFEALRADMKAHYDYVLIDSRTGLSDVASICTVQLPDVLVDCFTLSTQGIEGAAQVARTIEGRRRPTPVRILPVPMRIDQAEKDRVDTGLAFAARLFSGLPSDMTESQRRAYWSSVEVPYQAFYAYEETLAVFADTPGSPKSLLYSFEQLAGHITGGAVPGLPRIDESLRLSTRAQFTRRAPAEIRSVLLDYTAGDENWADWIKTILGRVDLEVIDSQREDTSRRAEDAPARVLKIVSSTEFTAPPVGQQFYVVNIADIPSVPQQPGLRGQTTLVGLNEREAIGKLARMLELRVQRLPEPGAGGADYPGAPPRIVRVPARNFRFTGRESDLRELRSKLREAGTAVLLPRTVALHGLGGVGKTQLALEYVHRFQNDYDVVWWVDASQSAFVDISLADLGGQIGREFEPIAPSGANVTEIAALVRETLNSGRLVKRWLLVFDNAEDIKTVSKWLPEGKGHVLLTSRDPAWAARATPLPVEVFTREESVTYLTRRAESITEEEAFQVAKKLGDLPLAVATAGAWLASTGVSVADYLDQLERQPSVALSLGQDENYSESVIKAWTLSLDRLAEQSPAAARLFDLCSLLAGQISLDLLYSPAMAEVLTPVDPALVEPMVMPRLVQQINKLALIKLDNGARQIQIHGLVQAVVKDRMSKEDMTKARTEIYKVLAAARPRREVDDPDTWPRYRMLWPHLGPSGAMDAQNETVRQLYLDRVRYLGQRGDLERGRDIAREAETTWREMRDQITEPGERATLDRQILRLQFSLSNILRDLSQFEESRLLDEAVLEEQRRLLGTDHPHTLMTANGLGGSLRALGRYRSALELDRETYDAWRDIFGDEDSRTLLSGNNLAVSFRLNGAFDDALELDRKVLDARRSTLGPNHPRTIDSAANMARDLLEKGSYFEAVREAEDIVETATDQKELGPEDRTTLRAQWLLGVALRSAGQPDAAQERFEVALDGLKRRFGADSPDTLGARLSTAANLLGLDRTEEGEAEIRAVLDVYRDRLGDTHPHTLASTVNLASAMRLQGRFEDALALVEETATKLDRFLGPDHPYSLAGSMVVGVLLADLRRQDQAIERERATAQLMAATLGPDHPDTLRCRANLELTRIELGETGAIEEREEVIARFTALVGDEHPNVSTLRGRRRLVRAVDPQPF
ncbi:tetratricopeptide repeat protein [Actinomadura barringtoniae]|uniref:Tetratricopeptide repeat protein n=1 Tax=Actinomadura barringtoniae TaxID=1427535 RepID=A0A939PE73_9ACTN|nr:FxSxx-COOH system tetratricopeptide repeat protein [Actinomadura barringtoniae]MBO2450956.1 tetratricopeptide repeat protein [Actinomadura barringtoniae]